MSEKEEIDFMEVYEIPKKFEELYLIAKEIATLTRIDSYPYLEGKQLKNVIFDRLVERAIQKGMVDEFLEQTWMDKGWKLKK